MARRRLVLMPSTRAADDRRRSLAALVEGMDIFPAPLRRPTAPGGLPGARAQQARALWEATRWVEGLVVPATDSSVALSSVAGMRRVLVEGRLLEVTVAPESGLCGLVVVVVSQWRGWRVSRLGQSRSGWIEAPSSKRVVFGLDGHVTLLDETGQPRWAIRVLDLLAAA